MRFAILTLLTALAGHVLWSAAVAVALERGYPHRVVDLRRWSGPAPRIGSQRELLARFISVELRDASKPTVAFLGSSFTFGYPWQERVILSRRYSDLRPDQQVVNASVTGGDLSLVNNWAICAFKRQGLMVDAAVIEIPVINTVANLAKQVKAQGGVAALESCSEPRVSDTYLPFVLRRPLGLGWVRFLWDVEAYEKPDESIVIIPVPEGYFVTAEQFVTVEPAYRAQIVDALTRARGIARKVYAFPSPVYLPALRDINQDDAAVSHQIEVTSEACRSVGGIECLDATSFHEMRAAYYNMTHLNQHGHKAVARWLSNRILR